MNTRSETFATDRTDDLQLLTDRELDHVVAGDLHVTKVVDAASPKLLTICASGKHIDW